MLISVAATCYIISEVMNSFFGLGFEISFSVVLRDFGLTGSYCFFGFLIRKHNINTVIEVQ